MGEVGYKTLAIDIETFSDVDLIKCGVYAYADSPAFEILLFAYSFDDEETKIIDLAQGEQLTEEIKNALSDVGIIKTAFNANFERTCLSKYMGVRLSPESWVCTAVQSAMLTLPSEHTDRSIASYFFTDVFAMRSRSFKASSTSPSASSINSATAPLDRLSISTPRSESHPFNCDTEFGFSSPVTS